MRLSEGRWAPDARQWRPKVPPIPDELEQATETNDVDSSSQEFMEPAPQRAAGNLDDATNQDSVEPAPQRPAGDFDKATEQDSVETAPQQPAGDFDDATNQDSLEPPPPAGRRGLCRREAPGVSRVGL